MKKTVNVSSGREVAVAWMDYYLNSFQLHHDKAVEALASQPSNVRENLTYPSCTSFPMMELRKSNWTSAMMSRQPGCCDVTCAQTVVTSIRVFWTTPFILTVPCSRT